MNHSRPIFIGKHQPPETSWWTDPELPRTLTAYDEFNGPGEAARERLKVMAP